MASRSRKSERQHNSKASQLRLDPFTIFLDENHSRNPHILKVLKEMLSKDEQVIQAAVHPDFPAGMLDEEWLPIIGRNGWIVVSADSRMAKRSVLRDVWFRAGVRGFLFTENNLRGETRAEMLHRALPEMRVLVRDNEPPFVATISVEGHATIVLDKHGQKRIKADEKKRQANIERRKKAKQKGKRRETHKRKAAVASSGKV